MNYYINNVLESLYIYIYIYIYIYGFNFVKNIEENFEFKRIFSGMNDQLIKKFSK